MTEHSDYKTRPDGSIDTAHYMARGREMRSAAFFAALGEFRRSFTRRASPTAKQRPTLTPAVTRPARA